MASEPGRFEDDELVNWMEVKEIGREGGRAK